MNSKIELHSKTEKSLLKWKWFIAWGNIADRKFLIQQKDFLDHTVKIDYC
jgi:hypothetical protein